MQRFAVLFVVLSAILAYVSNVRADAVGVYDDASQVTCGNSTAHCVYLKNAFTYGDKDGKPVACTQRDANGYGIGTCKFPNNSTTTIQCQYKKKDVFYVKFEHDQSSFKFKGNASAIWSSERNGSNSTIGSNSTSEAGDDLYITCPGKKAEK